MGSSSTGGVALLNSIAFLFSIFPTASLFFPLSVTSHQGGAHWLPCLPGSRAALTHATRARVPVVGPSSFPSLASFLFFPFFSFLFFLSFLHSFPSFLHLCAQIAHDPMSFIPNSLQVVSLFLCNRHRGDSSPCGQSPMDFESISLAARTQCLLPAGVPTH